MSQPPLPARVRDNPKFAQLVARRSRFALLLSLLVLVPYYTFMMVVAFQPDLLRAPLGEGVTTVAWPVGAALVIGSWLLTGLYVRRANGEFDSLNAELLKEARQ